MKILRISHNEWTQSQKVALEAYGMIVAELSPTPLSALTAMRIRREADRSKPDLLMVYRQKDALAAISAKKIAKHNSYKIVFAVEPNSQTPPVIHKPVIEGVDKWIFESERLYQLYNDNLHNKTLLTPSPVVASSISAPDMSAKPPIIAWIGDITDTERLKQTLDKIDDLDGRFILRISGGGVARDVMPAVRYSRALRNADKVVWVGEEYDKNKEIEMCTAAVTTNTDMTRIEAEIMQSGRRVLSPDEIAAFVQNPTPYPTPEKFNSEKYIMTLRQILS